MSACETGSVGEAMFRELERAVEDKPRTIPVPMIPKAPVALDGDSEVRKQRALETITEVNSILGFPQTKNIFWEPETSDFILETPTTIFHIHKRVLAHRTTGFKEGLAEIKARTGIDETSMFIEGDYGAPSVWRFLKWCYTGDYPTKLGSFVESEPELAGVKDDTAYLKHVKVYALADSLGQEALKEHAAERQATFLSFRLSRLSQKLKRDSEFASQANFHTIISEIKEFSAMIRVVYENTENSLSGWDSLRLVVLDVAIEHRQVLSESNAFCDLLEETSGDFAVDYAMRLSMLKNKDEKVEWKRKALRPVNWKDIIGGGSVSFVRAKLPIGIQARGGILGLRPEGSRI